MKHKFLIALAIAAAATSFVAAAAERSALTSPAKQLPIIGLADPASVGDFSADPDQSGIHAAKIKGKYNTCYTRPKTEVFPKGYNCFSNDTGACVSGDCCGLFGC